MLMMLMDQNTGTSFLGTLAAVLGWTTLYFTLCLLQPKRSYEWHCRTVTVVHGTLVTSLSAWCGFIQGPWPFTHPGGPNTSLQQLTVTLCLGYFIYDCIWCLYFQTEGLVMLFHHFLSIFGNALVLYTGKSGTEMIATIFGSELTNPLLQARWFLRETGRHKTWYAELNDLGFMGLFGFLRVGIGSRLLYCYLWHPLPGNVTKIGGILFYMVSFIWWVAILRYAKRKYTKMYREWRTQDLHATHYSSDKICMNGTSFHGVNCTETIRSRATQNGCNSTDINGHLPDVNGKKSD